MALEAYKVWVNESPAECATGWKKLISQLAFFSFSDKCDSALLRVIAFAKCQPMKKEIG